LVLLFGSLVEELTIYLRIFQDYVFNSTYRIGFFSVVKCAVLQITDAVKEQLS
jgi:hypothetical protein